MLRIEITNVETGTETHGNYVYVVRVGDKVIEHGEIKGHKLSDGWRYLVTLVGTPPSFRSAIPNNVTIKINKT